MPEISYALILTRDAERAARAVRSIARQTPDAELLLVLNDADDDMRALAHTVPGSRILHDGEDIGVVWGWNLALREARAEAVLVMHEDTELGDGCADRLLRTLRERPDAGAIAPRVVLAGGPAAHEGAVVWRDGATSRVPSMPSDVHPADYATSSCMLVRREVALGVGGFDERFFPAVYADTSFGVALWRAGRTVLCDRRTSSLHRVGAMVDLARGPRRSPRFRSFLLTRNRARFEHVFRDWLAGQAERADAVDARHPPPEELEEALARTRRREREVLAAPLAPLGDRLALPPELEAAAVRRREALVDEFLAELIHREEALTEDAAGLHRAYADLHRGTPSCTPSTSACIASTPSATRSSSASIGRTRSCGRIASVSARSRRRCSPRTSMLENRPDPGTSTPLARPSDRDARRRARRRARRTG